MEGDIQAIAMYLPQFHRTGENDLWWGEGFTDWQAVRNAVPLKEGHIQPKVPLHGNYYDLLDRQTMMWQAQLAEEYGIDGFCFYHYWFAQGMKLLEKPAENLLHDPEIPMRFCFCWANESWARSWSAVPDSNSWAYTFEDKSTQEGPQILALQEYGNEEDWREHFRYLLPFFRDPRYIRKDGKPVFVFYKPEIIPCLDEMIALWRKLASETGLSGLYLIGANMHRADHMLDAALQHGPNSYIPYIQVPEGTDTGRFYDCEEVWKRALHTEPAVNMTTCFGAFMGYDDTPRRGGKGVILENNTPELFEKYLIQLIRKNLIHGNDLIFINAWNEWGEGNMLEPDEQYGYGYLEALKRIRSSQEYMTEKEYVLHHFAEHFPKENYLLYGSSANAEALVTYFDKDYHFMGLIDDRLKEDRFGKPVYSVSEAVRKKPDAVIIAAQISSMYEIYDRIGEVFREAGIPVYDMYGHELHGLFETVRRQAYYRLSDWKEQIRAHDILSVDVMDTFMYRDIVNEGRVYANPFMKDLYMYARSLGREVYFIADDQLPAEIQMYALAQEGIDPGHVLVQEDLDRNKLNGLFRILRLRHPESRILHTGNDLLCDVIAPRMYDIDTIHFGVLQNTAVRERETVPVKSDPKTLQALTEQYDIVSFDIFDTLLVRMVKEPEDIFALLEGKFRKEGICTGPFALHRKMAQESLNEPTLPEIYEKLKEDTGIDEGTKEKMYRAELEMEKSLLLPRSGITEILREVSRKGKAVLTSDTYFTETEMRELLASAGIHEDIPMYLSCAYRMRKGRGLFREAVQDHPGKRILHIGDTAVHDRIPAEREGIDFFPVTEVHSHRQNITDTDTLSGKVLQGMYEALAYSDIFGQDAEMAGLAAFVTLKYTLWLIGHPALRDMDAVLFTSRDGYLFKQSYDLFRQNDPSLPLSLYFYTSRYASGKLLMDREGIQKMILSRMSCREDVLAYFEIGEDDPDKSLSEILKIHAQQIHRCTLQNRRNYYRYLERLGLKISGRYAVTDFCAAGSVQAILGEVSPFELTGFYYCINRMNPGSDVKIYACEEDHTLQETYTELEKYLSAPEGTVRCYGENGPQLAEAEKEITDVNAVRQRICIAVLRIAAILCESCAS